MIAVNDVCMCVTVALMDHSEFDCFALAFLTHGENGNVLYGVDGIITLDNLLAPIMTCPTLAGKPKICIVQVISHMT